MEIDAALEAAISEAVSEAGQRPEVTSRIIAWFKALAIQENQSDGQDFDYLEHVLDMIDASALDNLE